MNRLKNIINSIFSKIYQYLWCIDRITIGILLLLISISSFELIPSLQILELRLNSGLLLGTKFQKHIIVVIIFLIGIFILSNLSPENNILLCGIVGLGALFLCILTLIISTKINGSKRWINLIVISLQPSVFLKNTLGIFFPFLLTKLNKKLAFIIICCGIVLLQPDFGMCILLFAIAITEILFMYDKELLKYSHLLVIGVGAVIVFLFFKGNYMITRVAKFFSSQGLYQSNIAIHNIKSTSLFGADNLPIIPDAPTDFIFASIISHYGILIGMFIIVLFVLFFVRNIQQAASLEGNKKIVIYGILAQIAYQSIFHIASNLNFIPPKGVNCPFLSFGRSEALANIFSIGTLLSMTKKKLI